MKSINCPLCNTDQTTPFDKAVWIRCENCKGMIFPNTGGPKILIAHESEEASEQIGEVLAKAGFSLVRAQHGGQAIEVLESVRPRAAVLDVALGEVLAFQVIEHLHSHEHLKHVRIVLVASVYNKTAYKRTPKSLYGADDYVEQHHIPDMLPAKLSALLDMGPPPTDMPMSERLQRIREAEQRGDLKGKKRVLAFAHSIVSDIALYHQAEIEKVVKEGDYEVLAPALTEGRRLLAETVSAEDIGEGDPILRAMESLIAVMRHAE
jgi:CheY-like chemotaxis protein